MVAGIGVGRARFAVAVHRKPRVEVDAAEVMAALADRMRRTAPGFEAACVIAHLDADRAVGLHLDALDHAPAVSAGFHLGRQPGDRTVGLHGHLPAVRGYRIEIVVRREDHDPALSFRVGR